MYFYLSTLRKKKTLWVSNEYFYYIVRKKSVQVVFGMALNLEFGLVFSVICTCTIDYNGLYTKRIRLY